MKKLQLHPAVPGQIEGTVFFCAFKHEGLPVHIVHGAVQIRRTKDISPGIPPMQGFLRFDLIRAVLAPEAVQAKGRALRERLRGSLRVHRAGADEYIVAVTVQGIQQQVHVLCGVGGHVHHQVKMHPPQAVAQGMPVRPNVPDARRLCLAAPVDDKNRVALFDKILRHKAADKGGAAGYQNVFHGRCPFPCLR